MSEQVFQSSRLKAFLLSGTIALGVSGVKNRIDTANAATQIPAAAIAPDELDNYETGVDRAWQAFVTPEGYVDDPLVPEGNGDGRGVGAVMLADAMLQAAARTGDQSLEESAANIINETTAASSVTGPFNLLAVGLLLRHGQEGDFGNAWSRLAGPVTSLAGRLESTIGGECLPRPDCYSNWRLVWAAGGSALLAAKVHGKTGSDVGDPNKIKSQITKNLAMAVQHAGEPAHSSLGGGRMAELSDPGSEPLSYEIFSSVLLELIAEQNPHAITPQVASLRAAADRYALAMMAPDGQLSIAGRSLDQSWVQAAAADLGARRALQDPAHAAQWRSYADRAITYLQTAYPVWPNGIIPVVPGLLANGGNPDIMDGYAFENQYGGLTQWFLQDALNHWPDPRAPRSPIPADRTNLLVDDLNSSGLVWGRSGDVWWDVSGHRTSFDPRFAQGLADVKVKDGTGWHDLLALRPIQTKLSSAWVLDQAGVKATPMLMKAYGNGHQAELTGDYKRADGRTIPTDWLISAAGKGITVAMAKPDQASLTTTLWLPEPRPAMTAPGARVTEHSCIVTASGRACPTTVSWTKGNKAVLRLELID